MVSHRVRWSIYIRNPDSHISELRCSLPVTILDKVLLQEVRAYTRASRRTVLGPGLDNAPIEDQDHDLAAPEEEEPALTIEDRELPSYTAHVRDRVANMFLPEAVTMRITNPWVINGTSPTSPTNHAAFMESATGHFALGEDRPAPPLVNTHDAMNIFAHAFNPDLSGSVSATLPSASVSSLPVVGVSGPQTPPIYGVNANASTAVSPRHGPSNSSSGYSTPLEVASHVMAHLPHAPGSGESTPLDWINCELMVSLSEDVRSRFQPPPPSEVSQPSSRGPSRGPSRGSSPERRQTASRSSSPEREHGHHQKGFGGFFKGAMKGLSFTKHHGHHSPHHLPWHNHHSNHSHSVTSVAPSSQPHHDTRQAPVRPSPSRQSSLVAVTPDPSIAHTYIPPSQSLSRPPSRPGSPTHSRRQSGSNLASGSSLPRASSISVLPISPTLSPTSANDAMLHKAFTEVPDYSIASKGFIGGVPPLSSLQGLPSYEESARLGDRYRHLAPPMRTATPDPVSASRTGGIGGAQVGLNQMASGSGLTDDRRVMSDGDLLRRFQGMGVNGEPVGPGVLENPVTPSGESSEDDGIQMRSKRRQTPARDDNV